MLMRLINFVSGIFSSENEEKKEKARENMQKNYLNDHAEQPKMDDYISSKKNQSMLDSQGISDFSGSGYNGPGNVDREKRNSNMNQTNY